MLSDGHAACKEALQLVVQKAAGLDRSVPHITACRSRQRKSGWTGVHTAGIYVELVQGKESRGWTGV